MIFFSAEEIFRESDLHLCATQSLSSAVTLRGSTAQCIPVQADLIHQFIIFHLPFLLTVTYCSLELQLQATADPASSSCESYYIPVTSCTCHAMRHICSLVSGFKSPAVPGQSVLFLLARSLLYTSCRPPFLLTTTPSHTVHIFYKLHLMPAFAPARCAILQLQLMLLLVPLCSSKWQLIGQFCLLC